MKILSAKDEFARRDIEMELRAMLAWMLPLWIDALDVKFMTWISVLRLLIRWLIRVWDASMLHGLFLIKMLKIGVFFGSWKLLIQIGGNVSV